MIEIVVFLLTVFIGYLIFGKKKENPYIRTHLKKWQIEAGRRQWSITATAKQRLDY